MNDFGEDADADKGSIRIKLSSYLHLVELVLIQYTWSTKRIRINDRKHNKGSFLGEYSNAYFGM
jgi:hypothetical protein